MPTPSRDHCRICGNNEWTQRTDGGRRCGFCQRKSDRKRRVNDKAKAASKNVDWVDRTREESDQELKTLHYDTFTYEEIMAARANDDVHLVPGINDPARPHSHGRQEFIR